MRIGIISEGTTEQAVIENILVGLGIESSDVLCIRPSLSYDETDLAHTNQRTIGTWQGVKNACLTLSEISDFLLIEGNDYVIIQIDTAECGEVDFNVTRPHKDSPTYNTDFRNLVSDKISTWLGNNFLEKTIYAICIEEIEAWILTIYNTDNRDTGMSANPKVKLREILNKRGVNNKHTSNNFDYYLTLTRPFRKHKNLKKYALSNISLLAFIEDVEARIIGNCENLD